MNKKELIEKLSEKMSTSKAEAGRVFDMIIEMIIEDMKKGEKVTIAGFGIFQVKDRKARMGINPKTGEKIQIPAKKAVKFRAAKDLKTAVL
jgi:nucleoid DNA-binding protein